MITWQSYENDPIDPSGDADTLRACVVAFVMVLALTWIYLSA
jgi:hypothetical protein